MRDAEEACEQARSMIVVVAGWCWPVEGEGGLMNMKSTVEIHRCGGG